MSDSPSHLNTNTGRSRPCDACRRRKSRCVTQPSKSVCVLCQFHGASSCTFVNDPQKHHRKRDRDSQAIERPRKRSKSQPTPEDNGPSTNTVYPLEDYDELRGPSLLKRNLGLQQHRFSSYVGLSMQLESRLLDRCEFNAQDEYNYPDRTSLRKVAPNVSFVLQKYSGTQTRADEIDQLDAIEKVVTPHGPSLVNLYFRIVHPSFPILHKKVFLEKYHRTHREFSPPCLGGVYLLALNWWHYNRELSSQEKPDIENLEQITRRALQDVIHRPKLSTLQGGLLLLQYGSSREGVWALSSQMVAIAQELGVHLECANWSIPDWEKGLRRRLAWSIFMLDKWMSLLLGRPSHIGEDDWPVERLTAEDFPETAADENNLEGSAEVDNGRLAFENVIRLSEITGQITRTFYSPRAAASSANVTQLLALAKPIQLKLRRWHQLLPESLRTNTTTVRKLSSTSSLQLAYYATEIALHGAIIMSSTSGNCDRSLLDICRNAARERVAGAIKFVKELKVEHLQSFWYFPSGMNLVSIGTFTAFLLVTSQSLGEVTFYKQLLEDYRWTLRVISRGTSFVEYAVQRLDVSLSCMDQMSSEELFDQRTVERAHCHNLQQVNGSIDGMDFPDLAIAGQDMSPDPPSPKRQAEFDAGDWTFDETFGLSPFGSLPISPEGDR